MKKATLRRIVRTLAKIDRIKEEYAYYVRACILDRIGTNDAFRKDDFIHDLNDLRFCIDQYSKARNELYKALVK